MPKLVEEIASVALSGDIQLEAFDGNRQSLQNIRPDDVHQKSVQEYRPGNNLWSSSTGTGDHAACIRAMDPALSPGTWLFWMTVIQGYWLVSLGGFCYCPCRS